MIQGMSTGDVVDDLELATADGDTKSLSELASGPVVIPLVRYYGCMPCRDYLAQLEVARPKIEALGYTVAGVGGAADYQARALMAHGIGFDLLLDPEHHLYDALSVGHFPWWKMLMPGTWRRYLRAARGARQGKITGHPLQSPGLAVLDSDLRIEFVHRGETLGDYPTVESLLEVLAGIATARRTEAGPS
jgi:peroxiredoxin